MSYTLEIRMQSHTIDCGLCGAPDDFNWGVPTTNGDVITTELANKLPWHETGNIAVCRKCFDRHESGELETFDRFYLHLEIGFERGGGI